MAYRVTDNEVRQIIDTDRDTTIFIESANLVVNEDLISAGLSEARLKQIELYLAAHFCVLVEEKGGMLEERIGESWDKYVGQYTQGLNLTRYGQQAVILDTSGILASKATPNKRAELRVV